MDRAELADFLRARRARVTPAEVGLPAGTRRRTPGLRREEVAQLAGMSVDYYIRLEQARGPRPSAQILRAMARALRLSDRERDHLFELVGAEPRADGGPRKDVPAGILHLLDRLDDAPAMVLDAMQNILAWNPMMAAVFGMDLSAVPEPRRNRLRFLFEGGPTGCPWPSDADRVRMRREAVADLRTTAARYPDCGKVRALVAELSAASPEFTALWAEHDVAARRGSSKTVRHPVVGEFTVDYETLFIPERDQRLVLYTAPVGTPSHEALRLLKVLGTQDLSAVSGPPA